MKWIKVFEDFNSIGGAKKLREFTEDYLAYLLDDQDVKIQIELGNEEGSYGLMIHKYAYGMDWLSIKDHFIPFLSMLIKDYDVFNTSIGLTKNGHWIPGKVYSVDEIINDNVSIDGKISNISIDLKEKE